MDRRCVLLLIVAWRQPARIEDSKRFFKYPQYDTMLRASRDLVMRAPVVRDIAVTFEVHPTMDRTFIYTILGGRIDPSAPLHGGRECRRQREAGIADEP